MITTELIVDNVAYVASRIFTIDNNTNEPKQLTLAPCLPTSRDFKLTVVIHGKEGSVTWPEKINWISGHPPTLSGKYSIVALRGSGNNVTGELEAIGH